jgi:hypothetical protein
MTYGTVTNGQSQPVSFTKEMTAPKFHFFKIAFFNQGEVVYANSFAANAQGP